MLNNDKNEKKNNKSVWYFDNYIFNCHISLKKMSKHAYIGRIQLKEKQKPI